MSRRPSDTRVRAAHVAMLGFVLADAASAHGHARLPHLDVMAGIRPAAAATPMPQGDAYTMGKALLALNDLPGALAQFRQALTQAPQSVDALNGVAVSYDRLGRPDIARVYYEGALALAPDDAALNNNFGYSLYLQGDLDGAVAPLRVAAASQDAQSAASARRTLALVADAMQAAKAPPSTVAVLAPSEHIEQTNAGEQRLVFDRAPVPQAMVATLGDDAHEVMVQTGWTASDDRRLLRQVAFEEHSERLAAAALDRTVAAALPGASAPLAVPILASAPAVTPLSANMGFDVAALLAVPRWHSPLSAGGAREPGLGQRRPTAGDGGGVRHALAPSGGAPVAGLFDSDDHELNAFAARLRARAQVRA